MSVTARSMRSAVLSCLVTCVVAIALAVAPLYVSSGDRVELVAQAQPLSSAVEAPASVSDHLVAAYDAFRPTLNYIASLAFWSGRFLPIPGAAIYHLSVAYATIADPMTYSLVHNFGEFLDGDVDLVGALDRIGNDFAGSVVNFVNTELVGHDNVVPPVDRANNTAEPWVRWVINAAISPMYYLPLPNIITVDQVEIFGELIGTVVSSAIDNLAGVVTRTIPVQQALSNVWTALMGVAVPQLIAREVQLWNPPSPSAAVPASTAAQTAEDTGTTTESATVSTTATVAAQALAKALPTGTALTDATTPATTPQTPSATPFPSGSATPTEVETSVMPTATAVSVATVAPSVPDVSDPPESSKASAPANDDEPLGATASDGPAAVTKHAAAQDDSLSRASTPPKVDRPSDHDDGDAPAGVTGSVANKPPSDRPTVGGTKTRAGDHGAAGADGHESSLQGAGEASAAA